MTVLQLAQLTPSFLSPQSVGQNHGQIIYIPAFSYDVEMLLQAGNKAYESDGTLLNNTNVILSVLDKLRLTFSGMYGWQRCQLLEKETPG